MKNNYDVKIRLRKSDRWRLSSGKHHTKVEAKAAQKYWKRKGWYARVTKVK